MAEKDGGVAIHLKKCVSCQIFKLCVNFLAVLAISDQPGPKVIKLFPFSTQLSMKFYLLINTKLLISTVVLLLSLAECKTFYAYEYENANISWHFHIH